MKPLLAKAIATFIGKRKEFQASSISAKNDVNDINAILNNIKRLQNEVKSPSAAKKTESFLQDAKIKYAELEEKMGRRKVLMDFLKVIESAVNALNQVNKTPPLNTHDKTAQLRVENLHLEASMGILKSLIDALNVYNHSVKALQHPSASEKTPSSDGPKRKKQVRQ
ncbi:MAG: hypothetical protein FJZ63_01695 [Chlamydiae bacterium]|nr:hypothetical protein [Chlamydiota bacterium]